MWKPTHNIGTLQCNGAEHRLLFRRLDDGGVLLEIHNMISNGMEWSTVDPVHLIDVCNGLLSELHEFTCDECGGRFPESKKLEEPPFKFCGYACSRKQPFIKRTLGRHLDARPQEFVFLPVEDREILMVKTSLGPYPVEKAWDNRKFIYLDECQDDPADIRRFSKVEGWKPKHTDEPS